MGHGQSRAKSTEMAPAALTTNISDGSLWLIDIVRALLRGTHDAQSSLRHLRGQSHLLELIVKCFVLSVDALVIELLEANPRGMREAAVTALLPTLVQLTTRQRRVLQQDTKELQLVLPISGVKQVLAADGRLLTDAKMDDLVDLSARREKS